MTNSDLLKKIISEKGIKKSKLIEALSISYTQLQRKIENKIEFKASEIMILCDTLNIDINLREKIFFNVDVDK